LGDPDFELIQTVIGAVHATIWDLDFNPRDPRSLDRLLDRIEDALDDAPNLKELFKLRPLAEKKSVLEAHINLLWRPAAITLPAAQSLSV
jgi:hypothetical protein